MSTKKALTNDDLVHWRKVLTPEQFYVTRQCGTERPFTGAYYNCAEPGDYFCSNCKAKLFSSATKFDSGTGWPSFWDAVDREAVTLTSDESHGMQRVEVACKQCAAHLGHVFDDGPTPTGKRYCINSASLVHAKDLK